MLRAILWQILFTLFVTSCVMLSGKRTTTTNISSIPHRGAVYIVHDSHIHDLIYEDKPKNKYKNFIASTNNDTTDGITISFQGFTPLVVVVPKGMNTKVLIVKKGYETTEFYVRGKREAVYLNGKNKACARDRYWSWLWGAGIIDEVVNGYIFGDMKSNLKGEYCKDVRHSYHIHLKPEYYLGGEVL